MSGDAASNSTSSNAGASSSVVRVLLVRHGETQHNVDGIIQGQLDTDLNPFGRLQAQLTGEHLSTVHIDEVYASPLKRARDTALYIIGQNESLQAASAPQLHTDARLMERYFGELQGSRRYDGHEPRDAEPIEQVWKRLASFWSEVLLADVTPANGTSPPTTSHTKPLQPALHKIADARSTYQNIPAITPAAVGAQSFARTVVLVSHGSALKNLIRYVPASTGKRRSTPRKLTSVLISSQRRANTEQAGRARSGSTRAERAGQLLHHRDPHPPSAPRPLCFFISHRDHRAVVRRLAPAAHCQGAARCQR